MELRDTMNADSTNPATKTDFYGMIEEIISLREKIAIQKRGNIRLRIPSYEDERVCALQAQLAEKLAVFDKGVLETARRIIDEKRTEYSPNPSVTAPEILAELCDISQMSSHVYLLRGKLSQRACIVLAKGGYVRDPDQQKGAKVPRYRLHGRE